MCTGPTARLAAQLAARLAASGTAGAAGIIDHAGVLRTVLIVLIV